MGLREAPSRQAKRAAAEMLAVLVNLPDKTERLDAAAVFVDAVIRTEFLTVRPWEEAS